MKMVLDDAAGLNLISGYGDGQVTVGGQSYPAGMLIFPRTLHTDWEVTHIDQICGRTLKPIVTQKPEILILGTGKTQRFPPPRVFASLMDAMIGYEVMDNAAACRTYNILLGEGRNAALALLPE